MKEIIFKFLIKKRNINLTIDNQFRNPLRWRRYPIDNTEEFRAWGIKISTGEFIPAEIYFRSIVIIYFGKRFKGFIKHHKPLQVKK